MIDIKTGKEMKAKDASVSLATLVPSSVITGSAGKEMTRREALKGGLAAILAASVAPSLCGSITRGLGYRNLAGRLEAIGGKSTPDWEGQTVLEVKIDNDNTTFSFGGGVSPNTAYVDWGDGTKDLTRSHVYSKGTYLIKIDKNATTFRLAWGSSASQSMITGIHNLGIGLTSLERSFSWNSGCPNLKFVHSVDCPNVLNLNDTFSHLHNCEEIILPDGFGENATTVNYCFYNCAIHSLTVPKNFGKSATQASSCFQMYDIKSHEIYFQDNHFGKLATDITNLFQCCKITGNLSFDFTNATNISLMFMYPWTTDIVCEGLFGVNAVKFDKLVNTQYGKLNRLSLPSGFGRNGDSTNTTLIGGNAKGNLQHLEMHGEQNGIRYSISVANAPLTVPSVISLFRSLQTPETPQTLTLNTHMRSTYEASDDYIAARDALTARGWTVAFA